MRAYVRVSTPGGPVELEPGDVIGRIPSAALRIDDPRVSEAHALISLRRGALHLLSLRRMVAVRGAPVSDVRLEPGLVVELADGVALVVEEVVAPAQVLALRGRGLGVRTLASVASVVAGPPLMVVGRFVPGAAAYLWSAGASWRLRIGARGDREVAAGDRFTVGDHALELCAVAIDQAGHATTQLHGRVGEPLRIVAHYDTVEIHRAGRPPAVIGGQSARVLSELVSYAGPVAWLACARQLWTDDADVHELRHRWDVALGRLRRRLREAGLRSDLVVTDRSGHAQVTLYEQDVVEDRT